MKFFIQIFQSFIK